MESKDEIYLQKKEMINSLSQQCIFYLNSNNLEKGKVAISDLCSIYHNIGYYDLEARSLYLLATFYKANKENDELELVLDKAIELYKMAIIESEDKKIYADNNDFFLDIAEDYLKINAYSKALDAALASIKHFSVGKNITRSIKLIYTIDSIRDRNINHFLNTIYGKQNIKGLKSEISFEHIDDYRDPIEDTPSFRVASISIEKEIKAELKKNNEEDDIERYYEIKKRILSDRFGIIWTTPSELKTE